ncbi:MAG: hypothetical protein ACI835_000466 [Planctomycetota bacterium]|jgi:hypothetical protein
MTQNHRGLLQQMEIALGRQLEARMEVPASALSAWIGSLLYRLRDHDSAPTRRVPCRVPIHRAVRFSPPR